MACSPMGSPGSGKTFTGARLAVNNAMSSQLLSFHTKVVYAGRRLPGSRRPAWQCYGASRDEYRCDSTGTRLVSAIAL